MDTRRNVRYGNGAIAQAPLVVAERGARRVLLVCGAHSFEASGAVKVLPELERVAEVERFSDFAPNTDAADLARGLAVAARFQPDLVLGVGGGSAMDMAKLLCAFTGEDQLTDAIATNRVAADRPALLLAPTTSGSGSEATHFAVVYIGDDKFSVADPGLRPQVAILDPALTLSGSAYQRATSGIDAVAQAIESLWAVSANEASRRWARHALGLLLPAIERFVHAPDDRSARAMTIGSHLAGRAIDVSRTTAAHALSYGITKGYGISHGHAVALSLGGFIEFHAAATPELLQDSVDPGVHAAALTEIATALGASDGPDARRRFTALVRGIGLSPSLPEAGITTEPERQALARAANAERLGNNPVRLTTEQLAEILG